MSNIYIGTINTKPFTETVTYTPGQKKDIQRHIAEGFALPLMEGLIGLMSEHYDKTGFKDSDSYLSAKGLIETLEKQYLAVINGE
jgi:hypothetical protein